MLSPKHLPKSKPSYDDQLKLPQIPSRKNIQSVKKSTPIVPDLPHIKNKAVRQNLSINKENNSLNLIQRKNSLDDEIKARLFEVQAAQKMVKNVLGGPQATVHVGGDMTNFELKIEVNREIIRKQRNKSHFTEQDSNASQKQKKNENQDEEGPKLKCVSSKDIVSESIQQIPPIAEMKLKIRQNSESECRVKKVDGNSEVEDQNKILFKSERKPKKSSKPKNQENSKVFKSIKEILQNPQKIVLEQEAKKVKKMVKFTIEELENRLKQMKNVGLNQSAVEDSSRNETQKKFDRKMTTTKSAGMIPIFDAPLCEDYTFKNWNRIEFAQPEQGNQDIKMNQNKMVKYHRSDFEHEVDQIQKLQMKSYKSIQKMVENRKLLIDLQLMNMNLKNKSSVVTEKKGEKKQNELSL